MIRRDPVNGGFLTYISEVRDLIGGISTQPGFRHMVNTTIDIALVQQMIEHDAFGIEELLKLTTTIFTLIGDLQSPARKAEYQEWFESFVTLCKQCPSLNNALNLLPAFFEIAAARIEELQIEVCWVHLYAILIIIYYRKTFVTVLSPHILL